MQAGVMKGEQRDGSLSDGALGREMAKKVVEHCSTGLVHLPLPPACSYPAFKITVVFKAFGIRLPCKYVARLSPIGVKQI